MAQKPTESTVEPTRNTIRGEGDSLVHVWWSPEGVSIATDLGPGEPGTLVHLDHAAAAYLAGILTVASGVKLDG